jgi:cytochrome c553
LCITPCLLVVLIMAILMILHWCTFLQLHVLLCKALFKLPDALFIWSTLCLSCHRDHKMENHIRWYPVGK